MQGRVAVTARTTSRGPHAEHYKAVLERNRLENIKVAKMTEAERDAYFQAKFSQDRNVATRMFSSTPAWMTQPQTTATSTATQRGNDSTPTPPNTGTTTTRTQGAVTMHASVAPAAARAVSSTVFGSGAPSMKLTTAITTDRPPTQLPLAPLCDGRQPPAAAKSKDMPQLLAELRLSNANLPLFPLTAATAAAAGGGGVGSKAYGAYAGGGGGGGGGVSSRLEPFNSSTAGGRPGYGKGTL